MCIYVCVCMHVYINVYIYVCACMHVYMYLCTHVCMYACVYYCIYVVLNLVMCLLTGILTLTTNNVCITLKELSNFISKFKLMMRNRIFRGVG